MSERVPSERRRTNDNPNAHTTGGAHTAAGTAGGTHQHAPARDWNNIVVALRCRRLLGPEVSCGGHQCVRVVGLNQVILEDPQTPAADDYLRIGKSKVR